MGSHERSRAASSTVADTATADAPSAVAVRRRPAPSQPAVLQVGSVDDPHEAAADRAADAALSRISELHDNSEPGHPAPVRRKGSAAPASVGRDGGATSSDFTQRIENKRGHGRSLDAGVRRSMEHGFGTSLTGIRIHTDSAAADAAAEIGALAFTTGRDIFFGKDQYRPGTPEGDHVIGHEIAHTLQSGGAARRISRRWDFNRGQSVKFQERTQEVRVLPPRAVFIVTDNDGDRMVVKAEDRETGLASLVGDLHVGVSGAKTVQYRKLEGRDIADFIVMLRNQPQVLEPTSWARMTTNYGGFFADYLPDDYATLPAPAQQDAIRDAVVRYIATTYNENGMYLQAMTLADGSTAEDAYGAPGPGGNAPAQNDRLRGMLETPGHMRALGKMTTLDFITGNIDRISGGNWGNYFVNPGGVITVIDNIDQATQTMWRDGRHAAPRGGSQAEDNFADLSPSRMVGTVRTLMGQFLDGDLLRWDAGSKAWLDQVMPNGDTRRDTFMQEFCDGMVESRRNFIKVFTSTRWSVTKSGKQARKIKKGLKGSAEDAQRVDRGSLTQESYYDRLKQVALILKRQR